MKTQHGLTLLAVLGLCLGLLSLPMTTGCGLLEEDDTDPLVWQDDDTDPNSPVEDYGWAVRVVDVAYGDDASFGQGRMPDVVLGASKGSDTGSQSLDVVSLGSGGFIVLSFGDGTCVVDGEGDDLAVLENPFYITGDEDNRYIEAARVEVSQDGVTYYPFPTSVDAFRLLGDPLRYSGFAGVEPVVEGATPDEVGGDRFDLADIGVDWARYVRITDAGGDPEDPGDKMAAGAGMSGFDLDAAGAIHLGSGDDCS